MDIQALQTQQLQLLAKKSLLTDEIAQVDKALGQIAAIIQFAQAQPKTEPQAEPQEAEKNPAE